MRATLLLIVVGLAGVLAWWFLGDGTRPRPDATSVPVAQPEGVMAVPELRLMPVAVEAERVSSAETDIEEDLAILGSVLTLYRRVYKENPVGLNHEIVRALSGGRANGGAFLAPDHHAINEKGELLDRWGTPFFFHQLSGSEMEVISAGPDKAMWTSDDVKSG